MAVAAAAVTAAATAAAVVAAAVVSVATTAVAIVVVAAEGSTAELASSAVVEATSSTADSHAANSNARIEAAARSQATPAPPPVSVPAELSTLATSIGQAWAQAYVSMLQEQERDIVGAWPGTIREARRQVLARIKSRLEPEQLDQLARITNLAARRGWETVSEPDLES